MQQQPGGGFLDQPHLLFNNNNNDAAAANNNPRKRGREINSTNSTTPMNSMISSSIHPASSAHRPHLALYSSKCRRLSTSLRLLSEDFSTQIKHQRDKIEQFLQAQGDQLRRTLAKKRQRHYRVLLGAAEESVARKLREKEAKVAAQRNAELQPGLYSLAPKYRFGRQG